MKMKRPILKVLLICLALITGILSLLWPHRAGPPRPRLKIVRQTVTQGQTIVFFRVEGVSDRRVQFDKVVKVLGDATNELVDMDAFFKIGTKAWPLGDPRQARKEFGIPAPTNAEIWRLRLNVQWDDPTDPNPIQRVKDWPTMWRAARLAGSPLRTSCWYTLNSFYGKGGQIIESDFITNRVSQN